MTEKEAERFYLGGNLEDEGKGESGLKGCVQSIQEEGELERAGLIFSCYIET